jgi:hypothetical protein
VQWDYVVHPAFADDPERLSGDVHVLAADLRGLMHTQPLVTAQEYGSSRATADARGEQGVYVTGGDGARDATGRARSLHAKHGIFEPVPGVLEPQVPGPQP